MKGLLSLFNILSHTRRADNTTSCDAFLCDVKLAASGLRGTGCLRARERETKIETTKRKRRTAVCVEKDKIHIYMVKKQTE